MNVILPVRMVEKGGRGYIFRSRVGAMSIFGIVPTVRDASDIKKTINPDRETKF
jgi:hypothetical protein